MLRNAKTGSRCCMLSGEKQAKITSCRRECYLLVLCTSEKSPRFSWYGISRKKLRKQLEHIFVSKVHLSSVQAGYLQGVLRSCKSGKVRENNCLAKVWGRIIENLSLVNLDIKLVVVVSSPAVLRWASGTSIQPHRCCMN